MSHNLNILNYIYEKFVCKNLASVGFYVGGMKEKELKETEKKQVILSTYSMCSEGLDIPSLTTEFLITPKTDVVQIVGRILRAKHLVTTPTIYDFVDSHDVFQRQWLKRKSYYKKQNYRIIGINSNEYSTNLNKWKVLNEFKENFNKKNCEIKNTKNISIKSNVSSDKSIANDSDTEEENNVEPEKPKDKYLCGKCLLPIKK
jgi:superfamily II DNA or RNA helicase